MTTTRPRPWTPEESKEAHAAAREVGGHVVPTATRDGYEIVGEAPGVAVGDGFGDGSGRGLPRVIWWRGPDGRPTIFPEAVAAALASQVAVRTW